MEIIDKNELKKTIDIALVELQEECVINKQYDDISPLQEMAAVLPCILKHAYSKRIIAKGKYHDQLVEELTAYLKEESLSDNSPYSEEDIGQVLTILLKYL